MFEAATIHTLFCRSVPTEVPLAANAAMAPSQLEHVPIAQNLLRLREQHMAHRRSLLSCPLDPDVSPHWPAYLASCAAISAAQPSNLAELAAKARAAKHEALTENGDEDCRNGNALDWAWELVNDLIRLDGGTA